MTSFLDVSETFCLRSTMWSCQTNNSQHSALIVCFWDFRSAIFAPYVEISVGALALRCHLANLTTALQRFYFACRPIAQPIGLQCGKESCLRLAILPCQTNKSFTGTWGGFLSSSVGSFPAAPAVVNK